MGVLEDGVFIEEETVEVIVIEGMGLIRTTLV